MVGAGQDGHQRSPFAGGRTPTASEIEAWALAQGWRRRETPGGPVAYVDQNGTIRAKLKKGSVLAPGSGTPHVELRDATGRRIDPSGNPVSRRSTGNHTPIHWDW